MIRKLLNKIIPRYIYRSAITGLYVTRAYAKMFPDNVVRERVK